MLLKDLENLESVKKDCDTKLQSKKKDFNEMKRQIETINLEETKLKQSLDQAVDQREGQKVACEKMKKSIKDLRDAL